MVETAQCEGMVEVEAARYEQTLPTPSPSIRPVKTAGTQRVKILSERLYTLLTIRVSKNTAVNWLTSRAFLKGNCAIKGWPGTCMD